MHSPLKIPIFLALDVDTEKEALRFVEETHEFVGGYKLGPRLTYRYGSPLIQKISKQATVFVDNKYNDIPSTVIAALKAAFESGASFATVHASNGSECLTQLAKLEATLNQERFFKILAVTVLTSFSEGKLPLNWAQLPIREHVNQLAADVVGSGLTGLVCSPEEVSQLRKHYVNAFLLTPGIRLPEEEKGDQSRVMSPSEAIQSGSSAIVIGRPILQASNPRTKAQQIYNSLMNFSR